MSHPIARARRAPPIPQGIKFVQDFGGFPIAAGLPVGFTSIWAGATPSIQAAAIPGSQSGQELKTSPGSGSRRALVYDAVGAALYGNILASVYGIGSNNIGLSSAFGVGVRLSGGSGTETGVICGLGESTLGARNLLRLTKMVNGVINSITSVAFPWAINTRYWIRLKVQGGVFRARVWAKGTPEPATWNITATDNDLGIASAGAWGLILYDANSDPAFDYMSMSIGGNGLAKVP